MNATAPGWHDIPVRDWEGRPLDCAACAHATLHAAGGCEPGRSCMQDAYARRIDRFFREHRELAAQHLDHPYFEVRAIAARHTVSMRSTSACTPSCSGMARLSRRMFIGQALRSARKPDSISIE